MPFHCTYTKRARLRDEIGVVRERDSGFLNGGIMNGTTEAYNAHHGIELAKQLRNIKLAMAVFKPVSSIGDFY